MSGPLIDFGMHNNMFIMGLGKVRFLFYIQSMYIPPVCCPLQIMYIVCDLIYIIITLCIMYIIMA